MKETALEAYAHQDLSFERLVEEMQPTRSLSHSPLFQVLFTLQNQTGTFLALPGLQTTRIPVETGTSKFDLSLMLEERERR